MTTYLLITSDKPTELTAFVGPKPPKKPEVDVLNDSDAWPNYYVDVITWKKAMETAKASRLPVVNVSTRDSVLFGLDLDTPVELEGCEVEVVMSDGWQPTYNNPDNSGLEQPSEPIAYRLKRSEPVKNLPEDWNHAKRAIRDDEGNWIGSEPFNLAHKKKKDLSKRLDNVSEKLKESPIEAKTQESQTDVFHEVEIALGLIKNYKHISSNMKDAVKILESIVTRN